MERSMCQRKTTYTRVGKPSQQHVSLGGTLRAACQGGLMRHSFGKSLGLGPIWEARWRSETAYFADREERVVSHRDIQMLGVVVKERRESPWIPEMGSTRWPQAESVFCASCLPLTTLSCSHLLYSTMQSKTVALCGLLFPVLFFLIFPVSPPT